MGKKKKKKKKKKPKLGLSPLPKKEPRYTHSPDSFLNEHPAWRLRLVEMEGPFGWHEITSEKLTEIRQKLANFESMTWNDILVIAGHQSHLIERYRICGPAQDRLEEIKQDDVDELLSLRLAGKERIWGILDGPILRVLWWDPDHQICPAEKKYT